jgi:hypothetical protein
VPACYAHEEHGHSTKAPPPSTYHDRESHLFSLPGKGVSVRSFPSYDHV